MVIKEIKHHEFLHKTFIDKREQQFEITHFLGVGATGEVFRVKPKGTSHSTLALKIFKPEFWLLYQKAPEQPKRLELMRSLVTENIPGLVKTYEVDYITKTHNVDFLPQYLDNLPYVLMEDAEGMSLAAMIDSHRENLLTHLGPDIVHDMYDQLLTTARALLHFNDVAHQDIKPANILWDDGRKKTTLLDLGLIKGVPSEYLETENAPFAGTIRYSPPEFLFENTPYKFNRDLYGSQMYYQLGATLFSVVTGIVPFAELNAPYAIIDALRANPLSVQFDAYCSSHRGSIPDDLQSLITASLVIEPHERFRAVQKVFRVLGKPLGRRPAIVMLYTGGTIAAEDGPGGGSYSQPMRIEKRDDPRLSQLSTTLNEMYCRTKLSANDVAPELLWFWLPPEHQIFSENANPRFLKALLSRLKLDDEDVTPNTHFILGVIVLHGTDTMDDSACIASLIGGEMPCVVLFTGANRSLDMPTTAVEGNWTSDGWQNIRDSMYFINVLGLFLKEVFVSFAGRVHLPVNVSKVDAKGLALAEYAAEGKRASGEPFVYQNHGMGTEYAFRLVDDFIINGLYPIKGFGYPEESGLRWSDIVRQAPSRLANHLRGSSIFKAAEAAESVDARVDCLDSVYMIDVEMSIPLSIPHESTRCVLVVGYLSGAMGDALQGVFEWCRENAVPVFQVSKTGLWPGRGYGESVRKLFGVTPATAHVLLAMAVEAARAGWDAVEGQDARSLVLELELVRFGNNECSMGAYVLGDVVGENQRISKLKEWGSALERVCGDCRSMIKQSSSDGYGRQQRKIRQIVSLRDSQLSINDVGDRLHLELAWFQEMAGRDCAAEYCVEKFKSGFELGASKVDTVVSEGGDASVGDRLSQVLGFVRHDGIVAFEEIELDGDLAQALKGRSSVRLSVKVKPKFEAVKHFPSVDCAILSEDTTKFLRDVRYRPDKLHEEGDSEHEWDVRYNQLKKSVWVEGVPAYYFAAFGFLKGAVTAVSEAVLLKLIEDNEVDQSAGMSLKELARSVHVVRCVNNKGSVSITLVMDFQMLGT